MPDYEKETVHQFVDTDRLFLVLPSLESYLRRLPPLHTGNKFEPGRSCTVVCDSCKCHSEVEILHAAIVIQKQEIPIFLQKLNHKIHCLALWGIELTEALALPQVSSRLSWYRFIRKLILHLVRLSIHKEVHLMVVEEVYDDRGKTHCPFDIFLLHLLQSKRIVCFFSLLK